MNFDIVLTYRLVSDYTHYPHNGDNDKVTNGLLVIGFFVILERAKTEVNSVSNEGTSLVFILVGIPDRIVSIN